VWTAAACYAGQIGACRLHFPFAEMVVVLTLQNFYRWIGSDAPFERGYPTVLTFAAEKARCLNALEDDLPLVDRALPECRSNQTPSLCRQLVDRP
jgi:hypothetical protein